MTELLWTLPALPLLGFLALSLGGRRLGERAAGAVGVGTVALAALLATLLAWTGQGHQPLWTWLRSGHLEVGVGLALDPLSSCFALVITWVGALIHLFAAGHMRGDPGYSRFFAWMNLFVAMMLVLVMADDLLLLYLGWEGVGLCSYLLIGFWYADPDNGRAARKAFVVTRIGDTALLIALLLLAVRIGTLHLAALVPAAIGTWARGDPLAVAVALLLLGGAVGKSAQVPLHVWLPDAMAGPTPVSALIHAATMVTAGVYLIARTHGLFALAPVAMEAVAVVGVVSLLLGGVEALFQRDLKRTLAWSTVSQIGYLFLALGVGAYGAAIFHFVTHALFKALLFLGAGAVIHAVGRQDLFAMGGLYRKLPLTFATFLIGALALCGFPLITGGFYSKEAILGGVVGRSPALWALGVLGVGLTSLYTFRMVFLVFFGEPKTEVGGRPGAVEAVPMVALAGLTVLSAALGAGLLEAWLQPVLPPAVHRGTLGEAALVSLVSLGGIGLAWWRFGARPQTPLQTGLVRFVRDGLGIDALYDRLVVRPLVALGTANQKDVVDRLFEGAAEAMAALHQELSLTQTGRLRGTLAVTVAGAVLLVGLALWGRP